MQALLAWTHAHPQGSLDDPKAGLLGTVSWLARALLLLPRVLEHAPDH